MSDSSEFEGRILLGRMVEVRRHYQPVGIVGWRRPIAEVVSVHLVSANDDVDPIEVWL